MAAEGACFSPYMMITSATQAVFGSMRRNEMDEAYELNEKFALDMQAMKEQFQSEQEEKKYDDLRAKMLVARKYRAEEKLETSKFNELKKEFETFVSDYLPIDEANFQVLIETAKEYRDKEYNAECPINILLLKTESRKLTYSRIWDKIENIESEIGNVKLRRWCDRDTMGNCAILNLHTAMTGIPTVVISPYILNGAIHFTAAIWEANETIGPMIRPMFSIPVNSELLKTADGRRQIEDKISLASTIIAGCARDCYMLSTQGATPTLPAYLEKHPDVKSTLQLEEYREMVSSICNEYIETTKLLTATGRKSGLLSNDEKLVLADMASKASQSISMLSLK